MPDSNHPDEIRQESNGAVIPGDSAFALSRGSFVVGPHADDLDHSGVIKNLIHDTMLDVDSSGVRPGQVADQLFVTRRRLIGVRRQDVKKALGLGLQPRGRELGWRPSSPVR